jgi:hypothetical protein
MHTRCSKSTGGLLKNTERWLRQKSFKSSLHASRKIDKAWSLKSNKLLLPPINDTIEITPNVTTSSPSVAYEDVSSMFVDYNKNMKNQMQQKIEKSLAKSFKFLNISSDSHITHTNQHASNSSVT